MANAAKSSASKSSIQRSASLFEEFTGHEGEIIERVTFPAYPKSVLVIGTLIDIGYVTVRDGNTERYRHQFKAVSRPLLCSSDDGKQLFIYGGRYNFTERGIVDK